MDSLKSQIPIFAREVSYFNDPIVVNDGFISIVYFQSEIQQRLTRCHLHAMPT